MCKIFKDYREEIEAYCRQNRLSADKVFSSPKCFNDEFVMLQHPDKERGKSGLLVETPAPVTLRIFKADEGLRFEQTEFTAQYLS